MPALLFFAFILASCSDNLQYNETAVRMAVNVLNKSDSILIGESVNFRAEINPSLFAAKSYFWIMGSNNNKLYYLPYTKKFEESGVYDVKFYVVDSLDDTISSGLTISVSHPVFCNSLSLEFFQGSPIFRWECSTSNANDKLTYKFSLKNKNSQAIFLPDTILTDSSLQLGYPLPNDYWEFRLTATNRYGFKAELDSTWNADE
jgi:hypothetical protein